MFFHLPLRLFDLADEGEHIHEHVGTIPSEAPQAKTHLYFFGNANNRCIEQ